MGPLVSILIPTRNRSGLLPNAILSALSQTYKNVEIIVTDNSSDNETERLVKERFEDVVVYSRNKGDIGPILNWRKALSMARGEYCILLPDDDYFLNPFYIEDAIKFAAKYNVKLVITDSVVGRSNKATIGSSGHVGLIDGKAFIEGYMDRYSIPTIANMFDRVLALELNAFSSNEILYSDVELWLRILSKEKAYCYNVPSVFYLFHGDNIVTNMTKSDIVRNSRYIGGAIGLLENRKLFRTLVDRYVFFVDNIYITIDYEVIKKIFHENEIKESPFPLFLKVMVGRLKSKLKALLKGAFK